MTFSLVHISDLHFKKDYPSIDRLRLLRDDVLNCTKGETVYLVFSGDLVDAGDDDLYLILLDEFVIKLYDHCKAIYTVPGNHDIQWSATSKTDCDNMLQDIDQTYLYSHGTALNLDNPFKEVNPLGNFLSFQELICSYQELGFFGALDTNKDFSIACLNSTWLSYPRSRGETDLGKLRIDSPVVTVFR